MLTYLGIKQTVEKKDEKSLEKKINKFNSKKKLNELKLAGTCINNS